MLLKQAVVFSVIFAVLNLIQKSFLARFVFFIDSLDLVLITVFLLGFLIPFKNRYSVFILSFFAGITSDIFSALPFGIFTLSFILSSFPFFRLSDFLQKNSIFSFSFLFIIFFVCLKIIFWFLIIFSGLIFKHSTFYLLAFNLMRIISEFILNLCIAVIIFFIIKPRILPVKN